MPQLSPLITNLALILIVAGFTSLLFKWLKQPVVLAYIVAGIIISFFISKETTEYENIETWADIGVIFLLFGLGLEFSFKKLMKVGVTAFISVAFIVFSMIGVGYLTGIAFGWSHITSLFLGAMLSMSSTMIIIKVFDDLHLNNKRFTGIVLGILIIEDLVAVLLMVLLSTIAVSKNVEGKEMFVSLFKLVTFLFFWFLLGTYLIPTFLRRMKPFLNDETLLIIVLSFCLGLVYLATRAGFSSALGAFIMGSILSETLDSERIEKMIVPIKNFFGAIFFISVGMLVHVATLGQYIVPILIISLVVIVGQMTLATIGILLSGQNLKTAVFSGFSLAQIGEFSYIIGALGLSLGVIETSLYQIIVSASIITIFTTPYVMKLAEPTNRFLEKKLPDKWQRILNRDASGMQIINEENVWKKFLSGLITTVLIYFLFSIIIVLFFFRYAVPIVSYYLPGIHGDIVCAIVILLTISPFLRAIIIKEDRSSEFMLLWNSNRTNRGPLIFTLVFRVLMCAGLITYVLFQFFHENFVISFTGALIILVLFLASRRIRIQTLRMERRFKENLNEKEKHEESKAPLTKGFANHLLERDLHLTNFAVKPYYSIVGKTLKELKFRQFFGVNIVTIVRGDQRIHIPNGDVRIYPEDQLIVLGTDKQMEAFQQEVEERRKKYTHLQEKEISEVQMKQISVEPHSPLVGKTIRTSRIQDDFDCLVVGIERNNSSIMNPSLDLKFEEGDLLWIVGESSNIKRMRGSELFQKNELND
ncbi:MAG: cation:proton antiporter [Candidatus Azobacteroides sp.]|nr:cation:proton antiporter [Candidatus Azobacteroides sp.]